jgi:hypothetical protein
LGKLIESGHRRCVFAPRREAALLFRAENSTHTDEIACSQSVVIASFRSILVIFAPKSTNKLQHQLRPNFASSSTDFVVAAVSRI